MNNVFNKMQLLKSSEDCNKFSKSVSYETLFIGATTIGTEHGKELGIEGVITRRTLVRRGYLIEQGAHANKESLFAGVTCFMRLPRRIQRMLLVMTIPVLALVFTIATISESRAECTATKNKWINTCYEWNPGEADNCGDGCTYTYADGKLTVTATKPDAVVSNGMFSSNFYESGNRPSITDVEIDGEFKTIGYAAFNILGANIHGKDWVLLVNKTGDNSFDSTIVSGTVIVDDGQTTLGDGPWSRLRTDFNGTLILPSSITSISNAFLTNLALGADAKVYCGAENCEEIFRNFDCDEAGKKRNASWITSCKNHLNNLLDGNLMPYPDGCAKMWSTGCIKCKSASFRLNDGYCDRIRYTPAEAAKVLRNDDTNEVIITFRN